MEQTHLEDYGIKILIKMAHDWEYNGFIISNVALPTRRMLPAGHNRNNTIVQHQILFDSTG